MIAISSVVVVWFDTNAIPTLSNMIILDILVYPMTFMVLQGHIGIFYRLLATVAL